jgi:hypothetical protein
MSAMRQAYQDRSDTYFTDRQLRARWHCSAMKLFRLREKGLLPRPVRIGDGGPNLTAAEHVHQLEGTLLAAGAE